MRVSAVRSMIAILCVALACCVQRPAVYDPVTPNASLSGAAVWWSPSLKLDSIDAASKRLAEPFAYPYDVVAPAKGSATQQEVVTNCSTYFKLRPQGFEPMSQPDLAAMKLEGASCEAIRALRSVRPASKGDTKSVVRDSSALSLLPPDLGPEEMPAERQRRESATRQGLARAAVDPRATVTSLDSTSIRVQSDAWRTDVVILGRGDFDGDGSDDLLLQPVSSAREGSWREVRLRLLSRQNGSPVLRVIREFAL